MMTAEFKICVFLWILRAVLGCQDSFEVSSEGLQSVSKLIFKNVTTAEKNQLLTWEIAGRDDKQFAHSVVMSSTGDILSGLLTWNEIKLAWTKQGDNIAYNATGDFENEVYWKITLPSCQKYEFRSGSDGKWWYSIGDIIFTNSENTEREFNYNEQVMRSLFNSTNYNTQEYQKRQESGLKRKKRSSDEDPSDESTPWYTKVYNFFFGSGSARKNESAGILTSLVRWVRQLSCDYNGPCDRDEPVAPNQPITPDLAEGATTPMAFPHANDELNPVATKRV